jgi:hypothetical protein
MTKSDLSPATEQGSDRQEYSDQHRFQAERTDTSVLFTWCPALAVVLVAAFSGPGVAAIVGLSLYIVMNTTDKPNEVVGVAE